MKYRVSVYPGSKFLLKKLPKLKENASLGVYDKAHIRFNVTHHLTLGGYPKEKGIHKQLVDLIDVNILSKGLLIYEIEEEQLALLMLLLS